MQKIQNDYKDKNVVVVMVSIDEERYKIPRFLEKNPASATILLSDGQVEGKYGVQGIPLNLVLDRHGMIRHRKTGFGPEGEKELRDMIESLLEK